MPKNWCFWTVVLEKTLESPLDCKEIQPVHFEGDQPWDFFGRTDAKAETSILWPPDAKSWLLWPWCWEGLKAGREGEEKRMRCLDGITNWWIWVWINFGSWWWTGRPGVLQSVGSQSWTWLSDWTEPNWKWLTLSFFPIFSWAVARNLYTESATLYFQERNHSVLTGVKFAFYTNKSICIFSSFA